MITKPLPVQYEYDDARPVEISQDCIHFNGIGDGGCESMVLNKHGEGFTFCKTNRKPYDLVVMALMIIVNRHAPDLGPITSDGDKSDWQPALDWLNSIGMGEYTMPPLI